MRKIKDLCTSFEAVNIEQHPLDNFAVHLFDTRRYDAYHQSTAAPDEGGYGIPIALKLLKHVNPDIDGFGDLGPNEKYVANKVIGGNDSLLLIVGDLGVGKTGFSRYLMSSILPRLVHRSTPKTARCPSVIYLDFLDEGGFPQKDFEGVREEFAKRLCDKLQVRLDEFFDVEEELTTVWSAILARPGDETVPPRPTNTACDFIRNRLRMERAEDLSKDRDAVIERRMRIRSDLEQRGYRLQYLAAIARYLKRNYFSGHETCFLVLIDNIDPQPMIVQQAAKLILKQFARLSSVRVVATARHTTYHQQFGDRGNETLDAAPFCGIDPLKVVVHRIDDFLDHPEQYREHVDAESFDLVCLGMRRLRDEIFVHETFRSLFSSLTGHSVRRGFLLAQNLITTSEYSLANLGLGH
jgi:hypothetical protein